ncbi:hypothetical protein M2401_002730 [Pseudomonas sp. JUb42]|nr:hypothetical protein [Pseudomonas sp. JUb42]
MSNHQPQNIQLSLSQYRYLYLTLKRPAMT